MRLFQKSSIYGVLFLTVFAAQVFSANLAYAHSGGLNADGCHAGSKPYHCHRSAKSTRKAAPVRSVIRGVNFRDYDCKHFDSQAEAQEFFIQAGSGDPHRLDADNDGIACEHLR